MTTDAHKTWVVLSVHVVLAAALLAVQMPPTLTDVLTQTLQSHVVTLLKAGWWLLLVLCWYAPGPVVLWNMLLSTVSLYFVIVATLFLGRQWFGEGTWSAGMIALSVGAALGVVIARRRLLVVQNVRRRRFADASLTQRVAEDIATIWDAGYLPKGSGTLGAWAALPLGYFIAPWPWVFQSALIVGLSGLAVVAVNRTYARWNSDDPSQVVVDEFVGCLIAMAFVPASLVNALGAFALFRVFDIWKPWPIRRLEKLPGAWGILADDIAAGVVAGALLRAALHFAR